MLYSFIHFTKNVAQCKYALLTSSDSYMNKEDDEKKSSEKGIVWWNH